MFHLNPILHCMYTHYRPFIPLALLLGLLPVLRAQTPSSPTTPTNVFDDIPAQYETVFSTLNEAYLATGLLGERAYPVFPIHNRLGDLAYDDSLVTAGTEFPFGVAMVRHMSKDPSGVSWLRDDYLDRSDSYSSHAKLNLGAVLVRFDRIRANAEQDGLLRADLAAKQIYDVAGRPRSPYYIDTALFVAALTPQLRTNSPTIELDTRDLMTNLSGAVSWAIDLGTGFQTFTPGQSFTYTFPSTGGEFPVTVRATIGGQTLLAHTLVQVAAQVQRSPPLVGRDSILIDANGDGDTSADGGGSLIIYTSDRGGDVLRDVIIFVGGYDPNNDRNFDQVTLEKLDRFRFPQAHPTYSGERMSNVIDETGHDIIYVDWADGGDYIQNNGQVVANAIKHINRLKAERGVCSESVIVGQSMGGLCTKIGLSLLEDEGYEHRISRFFSWDSPHKGANIPINLQAMSAYAIDLMLKYGINGEAFTRLSRSHASPAATQLKLYHTHADNRFGIGKKEIYYDNTRFTEFQAYYQSLSIDVPHFAISNGSATDDQLAVSGGTQTVVPGGRILKADATGGGTTGLGGGIADMTIRCNFLPDDFTARGFAIVGLRFLELPIPIPFHNRFHADIPNYDVAPASTSDNGLAEVAPFAEDNPYAFGLSWWGVFGFDTKIDLATRYFAFVPTASSQQLDGELDVTAPVSVPSGGDITLGVRSSDESYENQIEDDPGPDEVFNHEHVTFTPQLAEFFVEYALPRAGTKLPDVDAGGAATLTQRYNFGTAGGQSTPSVLDGARLVTGAGQLYVNRAGPIGLASANLPVNDPARFDVLLTSGEASCIENGTAVVTVASGGRFHVGEGSRVATVTAEEGTQVRIRDGGSMAIDPGSAFVLASDGPGGNDGIVVEAGGVLTVAGQASGPAADGLLVRGGTALILAGGTLRVERSGQVLVTEGGRLIIEPGARIEFADPDHPNESEGVLHVTPSGRLHVTDDYSFTGPGYLRIGAAASLEGPADFKMDGEGKAYRRLQLDATLDLPAARNVELYNLGIVGGGLRVREGGAIDVHLVSWTDGRGLYTDGRASANLRSSTFEDMGSAFELDGFANRTLQSVRIFNCEFRRVSASSPAVILSGHLSEDPIAVRPVVSRSTFVDCPYGVYLQDLQDVVIERSSFTGDYAIGVEVNLTDHLALYDNTMVADAAGATGVRLHDEFGTATVRGGRYADHENAFHLTFGAVDFSGCVEIVGSTHAGIFREAVHPNKSRDDGVSIVLAGARITNNFYGIFGDRIYISRRTNDLGQKLRNTLGVKTVGADTSWFYSIDYTGKIPTVDLTENEWRVDDAEGRAYHSWFCSFDYNASCVTGYADYDAGSGGCGTECSSPSRCADFCDRYPEDPQCTGHCSQSEPGFVSVYPNPAHDKIGLANLQCEEFELQVYDPNGMNVLGGGHIATGGFGEVDVSGLNSGSFHVEIIEHVETDDGIEDVHSMHHLIILDD